LFYRDAAISVSDRWLTVLGRRFAVSELHGLRTVREPQAGNGVVIMIGVAGIALASVFALAANVASTATIVAAPLLAALLVGAALATLRLRRRHFALYAEYRGRTVQVFGATDERRYNQICRALLRAREYDQDHR